MRRQSAVLLLAVLAVAAGLRLSAVALDTEAMRCAIACGHALGGAGAVCCPMGRRADEGPTLMTCSHPDGAPLPTAAAQPLLLSTECRLASPVTGGSLDLGPAAASRLAPPRPHDHVPLLLA